MIIVIADTSGLLAALDSNHPEHQASNEAIMAAGLLVMSPLLLAEIDHVATRELGREAALSAVDDIRTWMRRGRIALPEITEDHLGVAQSVRARYRGLDLDLADAVNVALAADYDTDAVLTLDRRDFRAVRPLGRHKAFRVLPDDLPL
ncbi:twitching motility protein PilT [Streptomyces globisporus C-1027]|uniref:Ribonuclease VapC n=1 Tax=Streptomyces globisporus C-1027 TaxID=1172567 RepID=A0A0U3KVA8_STRGL|nr:MULTISPECIES: PIN domain-containing protein [Streptomyces]ALU96710.1 twitching motility protein PilT [Streptomyces globisporus C-1027]OKJ25391.1 twitching motility protein PilT [Streptomyces sp. CB02130]